MSSDDEIIDDATKASEAIAGLIKAAGESSQGKVAADNLGKTAVTITSTINNALLPLAAVNYAFDKAKKYFTEKFANDFKQKAKNISSEQLVEPDPSIAGPVLQGLAFNHENEDLREMYLNLLSVAVDDSRNNTAHPAFVDVLRQITPFEAQIINQLLSEPSTPIARVVLVDKDFETTRKANHMVSVKQHLLNIIDSETGICSADSRLELMVDNYCRLGLITVDYEKSLADEDEYMWAYEHPLFKLYNDGNGGKGTLTSNDGKHTFRVALQFGILRLTVFGNLFAVAVGINDIPTHTNET